MKMRWNKKRGASIILLILVIVVTVSICISVIASFSNVNLMQMELENDFKSSLIAYKDEVNRYITIEQKEDKNFKIEKMEFFGDRLREIIPYIKEEDMAKIAIKNGKIVYIGNDESERKWTQELTANE